MKLYGSPTSPFVRKTRVFAIERGVPFEFVKEDPWQRSERLQAMTPLGKVPVLECEDGRVVIDSWAIIEYLDAAGNPSEQLLPPPGPARWDALHGHALGHGLIDAVVARLLESRRPAEFQMPERMKREEERIAATFDAIEAIAPAMQSNGTNRPGLAALMIATAALYTDFRYPHDWRSGRPALAGMVAALEGRPAFTMTVPPA